MKFGIDISHYDGTKIDWNQANSKLDFLFIKAFEYREDSSFKSNWEKSKGLIPRGAYYFWRQGPDLVNKQRTEEFLRVIGGENYNGELPPVIDLEDKLAKNELVFGQIDTLSERIKQVTGVYPIIYTGLNYWAVTCAQKASQSWCDAHIFWFSLPNVDYSKNFELDYRNIMAGVKEPFIPAVNKIKNLDFLQWTYRGKPEDIPGYPRGVLDKKAIDFNFYLKGEEKFSKLVGNEIQQPPTEELTLEQKVELLYKDYLSRISR